MRKPKLIILMGLLFCVQFLWAQTPITGRVTDRNGNALPNATITVKNTTVSAVSDLNGVFSINAAPNATLIISSVGYQTIEIVATGSNVLAQLIPGENTLTEVVVTGYGTKVKRDLTGNIARVRGSEVANIPVPNFNQALQGRAAGVFVESNNGKVGEGVKIRIRGAGSISASNEPLYVIDGVPINTSSLSGNALADINFNDIESFDILKDAAAASIYGSNAANGVVIITTKKGRSGRTDLAVNMQYGSNKPTNYRGFLNAAEYVQLIQEAALNSDIINGISPTSNSSDTRFVEGRLTRYSGHSNWRTLETDTDWEKLAFNKNARTKMVDVTASGGSDKTRFFISGGFSDQEGILILNDFQRISSRFNLEHEASQKLKLGFNLSLSRTVGNRNNLDNAFQSPMQLVALAPITPPRDLNGVLYDRPVTTYYNGLIELENSVYKSTTFRNIGNLFLNYNIIRDLSFRSEVGADLQTQNDELFRGSRTLTGLSTNGYGSSSWLRSLTLNTNNYFNYIKELGTIHDIDATLGMAFQNTTTDLASVTGEDFPVDALQKLASAGRITGGSSSLTEASLVSYFARANYKLLDRYLFNVSGRIDGSSRFGANSRYGFFPAVSAGWILSEEAFLSNSSAISFLKLRASYGTNGNWAGFGNFSHLGLYGGSKYNNVSGLVPTQLPNPDLKWERNNQFDIGIDFGFLNNRLTGELDYYKRKTDDLIYSLPVPGTSGFATQIFNVGAMENRGVELVLNSTNIQSKNFFWTTSFNIAKNRNKVTRLDGDQSLIPGNDGRFLNSLLVGESIGIFYGPKYAGVDPANGDALYYREDGTSTTNNYNQAGNFIVGDPNPDWIGGLNNVFKFYGFELNVLFQGVFGNQIMNGAGGFMSAGFDWFDNQTRDQLRRWQKPGDITDVPQLRFDKGNGVNASSRYVEDGSYIRLKNLTFAYNVPGNVMNRLKVRSARVFVTGVNLLTFTDYTGWDPEVNTDYRAGNRNQGSDFYAAPQIKSVTFGINLGL